MHIDFADRPVFFFESKEEEAGISWWPSTEPSFRLQTTMDLEVDACANDDTGMLVSERLLFSIRSLASPCDSNWSKGR